MKADQIDTLLKILDRAVSVAERWADAEYPKRDEDATAELYRQGDPEEPKSPQEYADLEAQEGRFAKKFRQAHSKPNQPKRRESALERLGIDPDELDALPPITEMLSRTFKTGRKAPKLQILEYLKASPSPCALAYLNVYQNLPVRDRESLSVEAVCIAAKISPLEILGAILMAAKNLKAQESALKAILAHPDVIDATVRNAKKEMGFADRKMLHEAVGFLPTKQGSPISINFGMNKKDEGGGERDDDDESFSEAFPTISGELEGWSDNRRLLTEGK